MKMSKLFVIALLTGTLAVIGCSSDPAPEGNGGSGGSGTGGTGGGAADPCTGPLCDAPEPEAFCLAIIEECNATVEIDPPPTPEQCDVLGNAAACQEGSTGGTGGAGGAGGDVGCNVLACTTDDELKARCEAAVDACFIYCAADEECQEDECLGLGLLICNLTEE